MDSLFCSHIAALILRIESSPALTIESKREVVEVVKEVAEKECKGRGFGPSFLL
jgi:hypothetical protein